MWNRERTTDCGPASRAEPEHGIDRSGCSPGEVLTSAVITVDEIHAFAEILDCSELPRDFQMPTTAEIEQDLNLGDPSWTRLLKAHYRGADPCLADTRPGTSKRHSTTLVFLAIAILGAGAVSAWNWTPPSNQPVPHQTVDSALAAPSPTSHFIWTARGPFSIESLTEVIDASEPTGEACDHPGRRSGC